MRVVVLMGLCVIAGLRAQSTEATIMGSVLDVAGKGISNAAVSIKNEANGAARQTAAGADGKFSVTGQVADPAAANELTVPSRQGDQLAEGQKSMTV